MFPFENFKLLASWRKYGDLLYLLESQLLAMPFFGSILILSKLKAMNSL
jgi:hypothetical protein